MRHSARTRPTDFALTGRPQRVGNDTSLAARTARMSARADGWSRDTSTRVACCPVSNRSIPKTLTMAGNLAHSLTQLTVRPFG